MRDCGISDAGDREQVQVGREVELKLECEGPDLAALAAHRLLGGRKGRAKHLLSTYYDTPSHALKAAGLTLRVRKEGARFVQTVKAGEGTPGLFDRDEWESTVAGETPVTEALADTPAAELLAGSEEGLVPVFRTVVARRQSRVTRNETVILAIVDEGRIETEAGDAVLGELELELVSGDPGELFGLAREIGESVPLRLGALSKSARGFRLVEGVGRAPSKAPPLALPEGASAAQAFQAIAGACLRHLRLNEAVFLLSRDPEALHQMRVALRRLRSAFSLFDPILAHDPAARALAEEIKRIAEPFGRARNLDVFLEETLPASAERRPDEPGLADLGARLGADRDAAHAAGLAVLASPEWRGLLLDLVAWTQTGPWLGEGGPPERDGPARDFAGLVLDRFRKRVKKRGRDLAGLDPEARHRVRIAAKKLRYGADFFASLFPEKTARKRHKAFAAALSDLQDHLGALNDLATAHTVLADVADGGPGSGRAAFAAGLTAADGEAGSAGLIEAAADAYDDLMDAKPFWR